MKKICVSVTEFAQPAPRKGSIEVNSGLGRGAVVGMELHQKIQKKRALESTDYQSEVLTSAEFSMSGEIFEVSGRMDGFFSTTPAKIEEIKSSFNVYELSRLLKTNYDHPYVLQLLTYGYFHWKKFAVKPQLVLLLVSSRNQQEIALDYELDLVWYESWLERRLAELVVEADRARKRMDRRKKAALALQFPFKQPRPGQRELISTIEDGMTENRPMLLQAPTGLGKTIGVMYPTLKNALHGGQKLIYLTPKNSQHSVAEEAIEHLQENGAKIRSLTITAKSKLCLKNEPICNPIYCEYAKDHYTKVSEFDLVEKLTKKKKLTARVFKKVAEEFQVCPFELQLDTAVNADTIICDYNYVFAPISAFGRLTGNGLLSEGKPNLVIDEAHNLPARAMGYYSPSLSVETLENMKTESRKVDKKFRNQFLKLLDFCIEIIKNCGSSSATRPCKIDPPISNFLIQDAELSGFLSTYLSADTEIQTGDPVMRLSFYWSEFTSALEFVSRGNKEFFTTFYPNPARIKITCCDASEMLKNTYTDYEQIIGFSATLKPFSYYRQLSGLNELNLKTSEFTSPFPKENRKILIIPQISSKFSERTRSYPRIADAIEKIVSLKSGNYIAFFPSFSFMESVLANIKSTLPFLVLKQNRSMKKTDIDQILETLKKNEEPCLLFAVQGGVFSEGVDYPGSMLIGAFIVGPPLPNFDLEREKMRDYYQQHYSAGFDYAYTFPAMAKAVQAAGRVIRSENDKGLIVLMDDRFIQPSFTQSMPQDWFDESPSESVSFKILKDVTDFWSSVD
jgi:DNA excision repair protein ERCC-2